MEPNVAGLTSYQMRHRRDQHPQYDKSKAGFGTHGTHKGVDKRDRRGVQPDLCLFLFVAAGSSRLAGIGQVRGPCFRKKLAAGLAGR